MTEGEMSEGMALIHTDAVRTDTITDGEVQEETLDMPGEGACLTRAHHRGTTTSPGHDPLLPPTALRANHP